MYRILYHYIDGRVSKASTSYESLDHALDDATLRINRAQSIEYVTILKTTYRGGPAAQVVFDSRTGKVSQ